jgi:hypothetical protein
MLLVRQLVELCASRSGVLFFRQILHVGKFRSPLGLPADHSRPNGLFDPLVQVI